MGTCMAAGSISLNILVEFYSENRSELNSEYVFAFFQCKI